MTILFTKGRELFEQDSKNQAFNKQTEETQKPKTRSRKMFKRKRK
ncbi:hypothetical protein JOC33_003120 [Thalassobacillus pellis]|nr:hypothetical protein [Thalassobacillus pellis]